MSRLSSNRGSAFLTTIIMLMIVGTLAAVGLRYSSQTYRLSQRQYAVERARLVAENEMEFLYYQWKAALYKPKAPEDIDAYLRGLSYTVAPESITTTTVTSSGQKISGLRTAPEGDSRTWKISRSLERDPMLHRGNTKIIGKITGTRKTGSVNYFVARVYVEATDANLGDVTYRLGRRFGIRESSLFQSSVFYQDLMEFSSGSDMTIKGDITGNGSIYIGASAGKELIIAGNVNYVEKFQGSEESLDGTTYRGPQTTTYDSSGNATNALVAPIFNPSPEIPIDAYDATDTSDAAKAYRSAQLEARKKQTEKIKGENFLGTVDADTALESYPDAYSSLNDVYRSIISPPPTDIAGNLIPEDPQVKASRMYNKSGIIIEVNSTGGVTITAGNTVISPTSDGYSTVTDILTTGESFYDSREGKNIKVTTLDIGKLTTLLSGSDSSPAVNAVKSAYNGTIYVYDKTRTVEPVKVGSTIVLPGLAAGVRLVNGATTPTSVNRGSGPVDINGFTITTDNGLYVQGDYNTTKTASGNQPNAALLADAVTMLSQGWDDANSKNSSSTVNDRRAVSGVDKAKDANGNTINTLAKDNTTTIAAAIISGNNPSDDAGGNSGGVQNLVRLLESWNGQNTYLFGSLGQLFASKNFTGKWSNTNIAKPNYSAPLGRTVEFNSRLAEAPSDTDPKTTSIARGDYFTW